MFHRRLHRVWLAYIVLFAGLALSVVAWLYVRESVAAVETTRFENAARMASQSVNQQMERYVDVLLATRGFIRSSTAVSRDEWRVYTNSIDLNQHFPGIQGIGYTVRVTPETRQRFESTLRAEGFKSFVITPPGERAAYYPVYYLEPFSAANRAMFGYDMYADPARREAMDRAALTGKPAATARMILRQGEPSDLEAGFLIFVPVYRPGVPTDTEAQRQAAIIGFVYSPYHAAALFKGLLGSQRYLDDIHWQIYAGSTSDPTQLLYDSANGEIVDEVRAIVPHESLTKVAGQPWFLRFAAEPRFRTPTETYLPLLVLLSGVLVSWLFCGITWLQIRGRTDSDRAAAELRRSEEALRASELRYRLKVEQSPMAIQVFSSSGDVQYTNPAFRELFDLGPNDLEGYNVLDDAQLARAEVMSDVRRAFSGESVAMGPYVYQPPRGKGGRGRARWVRTVMYPIREPDGALREIVVMHEDFTQRKAAEEELHRAKESAEAANRAKDQFLAVLSHELRNPLAPVLTTVNTLQRYRLSPDEFVDALNVIQRNVELEARLIDDLLDITRITRGKLNLDLQTIDAHVAVRHALEICQSDARQKHLHVSVHLEAGEHFVRADPARLQQVFWNILKNAVKFTHEGGAITIRTRNRPHVPPLHNGGVEPAGDHHPAHDLVVEISDTGIGIEPDKLARVFEAFEQIDQTITRRFGGLGLGLAISRALVEAHRGTLDAHSAGTNRGTTFTMALPAVPAPAPVPSPPAAAPRPPAGPPPLPQTEEAFAAGTQPRILLVEDQDDARRGLRLLLEKSGYHVLAASNVREALDLARHENFDVLLSDLGLPDASGFDLVRALRTRCAHGFYALALSGLGMEDDIQRARAAGFDQHLTKPVPFARLISLIDQATARAS